ncbi:MAG: hypothetical protein R2845_05600 [Thermomicrobiales bacterium]
MEPAELVLWTDDTDVALFEQLVTDGVAGDVGPAISLNLRTVWVRDPTGIPFTSVPTCRNPVPMLIRVF